MGINVKWDQNDTKVVYMTIDGGWTWDDYYESQQTLYQMIEGSSYPVIDVILDMQNSNMFPKNVMSGMERQSKNNHEKTGMMAVVGAGAFAKVLFNMMERITPSRMSRVKLVDSVEKARELIQQYRAETIHRRPQS